MSAGVASSAASAATFGSMIARASNTSRASRLVGRATNAPRLGSSWISRSCDSACSAERTMVRLTE